MAGSQRLPAPADRMASGTEQPHVKRTVLLTAPAPPDQAQQGDRIGQDVQGPPQFSAPIAAATAVAAFLALTAGMDIFDGWQHTLVFASGPIALFLAMSPRDQAGGGPDQPARDWLGKVFSLALGGLFLAGGSLLVGAIVDILAGSPGWIQHPLPIIAIQYAPALYLWIKRKRLLST